MGSIENPIEVKENSTIDVGLYGNTYFKYKVQEDCEIKFMIKSINDQSIKSSISRVTVLYYGTDSKYLNCKDMIVLRTSSIYDNVKKGEYIYLKFKDIADPYAIGKKINFIIEETK